MKINILKFQSVNWNIKENLEYRSGEREKNAYTKINIINKGNNSVCKIIL
jgi:type IV secretory pathway ATPase VirB11/archaellum biosynthesis ATPase